MVIIFMYKPRSIAYRLHLRKYDFTNNTLTSSILLYAIYKLLTKSYCLDIKHPNVSLTEHQYKIALLLYNEFIRISPFEEDIIASLNKTLTKDGTTISIHLMPGPYIIIK